MVRLSQVLTASLRSMVSSYFAHFFPSQESKRDFQSQLEGGWEVLLWYSVLAMKTHWGVGKNSVVNDAGMDYCRNGLLENNKYLNPSKMSLEFSRSFDGENKMPFLEIVYALWFPREILRTAQKDNVVIQFRDPR